MQRSQSWTSTSELVTKQESQTNTPEACRATERGWNPIVTLEEPGAVHIRQEVPVSLAGPDRENSHTQTGHGDHGADKHLLKCNNVTNVTCNNVTWLTTYRFYCFNEMCTIFKCVRWNLKGQVIITPDIWISPSIWQWIWNVQTYRITVLIVLNSATLITGLLARPQHTVIGIFFMFDVGLCFIFLDVSIKDV